MHHTWEILAQVTIPCAAPLMKTFVLWTLQKIEKLTECKHHIHTEIKEGGREGRQEGRNEGKEGGREGGREEEVRAVARLVSDCLVCTESWS